MNTHKKTLRFSDVVCWIKKKGRPPGCAQGDRFRARPRLWGQGGAHDADLGDALVPAARAAVRFTQLRRRRRRVVSGLHFCRARAPRAVPAGQQRDRPARDFFHSPEQPDEGQLANCGILFGIINL